MAGIDLKNVNFKRHLNTYLKVLMNMKVLGLLVLLGFTFYGIGWDTVLRPNLEQMKQRDDAMQQQREVLSQKKGLQDQYKTWQEDLKNLDVDMVPIPPGDSSKVLTVTESSKLLALAQGKNRDEKLTPPLSPPHDTRTGVSLTPGTTTDVDLLLPEGETAAAAGAPPAQAAPPPSGPPHSSSGGPMGGPPGSGPGGPGMPGNPGGMSTHPGGMPGPSATTAPTTLPAEKFDFEMKMTGTYPAVIDFINQLNTYPTIVRINKVSLDRVAEAEEPDPKEYPNYPVKVEMTLTLSMYLYAAPLQAPH